MSRIAKAAVIIVGTGAVALSGAGVAVAAAEADAAAVNSPGVISGNIIQVPIHVPINLCGNTINLVGLLNPAFGNVCINKDGDKKKSESDYDNGKGHDDYNNGDNGYGGNSHMG
ncbi:MULTISPECIES: chaplin [unclassified Streptomyces]|uniref:chaplin n=1 Tax=unclassified Streptomyces TaxID=2593676 RepID=UPI0033AFCD40